MIDLNGPPELDGFQFSFCFHPWRDNGNDFLAFIHLGNDRLALIVADFMGFQPVPAELKERLSTETKRCLTQEAEMGKAVELLNTCIYRGADDVPFMMFMAFVFKAGSQFVSVVNAGHYPPLIYRRETNAISELTTLHSTYLPLGIAEGTVGYEPAQISLCEGDTIAVFTDGIPEAANKQHKMFGVAAIRRLMAEGGSVDAIRNRIMKAVAGHIGSEDRDDATLAVIRYIYP